MDIQTPLFEGERLRLGPIDHEKDAEIESRWTHDPDYLRLINTEPVRPHLAAGPIRPLSVAALKKRYTALEKEIEESKNLFYFTLRLRADDRLIGYAQLHWIEWNNSTGHLSLGIGDPADRRQGYGTEALRLLLHLTFAELNLYRLSALVPEYNQPALGLFRKFGFIEEVRRRQALNRDGRRWDMLYLGLLREEWQHD